MRQVFPGQLAIDTAAVVDGIEMLVFEFGIDSNFDGQTDYFVPASEVAAAVWQQKQWAGGTAPLFCAVTESDTRSFLHQPAAVQFGST